MTWRRIVENLLFAVVTSIQILVCRPDFRQRSFAPSDGGRPPLQSW